MRVGDLLRRKTGTVITVRESDTLATAVHRLIEHGVGGVVVVNDAGSLTGFVSERDVVYVLNRYSGDVRNLHVANAMRRAAVCAPDDSVTDVMQRMTSERLRHFVAVADGRPVGVISVGDIVKQRLVELELEAGVLRDYVAGQRAV